MCVQEANRALPKLIQNHNRSFAVKPQESRISLPLTACRNVPGACVFRSGIPSHRSRPDAILWRKNLLVRQYHISPEDLPELSTFMGHFDEYCHRLETWQAMEDYIKGLLMPIERKNCEQMAAAIPGCHAQRLHHLLTKATWDEQAVNSKRLELFLQRFGREPGYLIFDDTGIPKKGSGSVGVARQYSGTLGKIGNCQVIVTSQFVTPQGKSCPADARLYLPTEWTDDSARCRLSHVPEENVFQTKTEIAIDLLDQAIASSLPIRTVLGDAGYGRNQTWWKPSKSGGFHICLLSRPASVYEK